MAQHYPVDLNKEIEIRRSLQRIGKYIRRSRWLMQRFATQPFSKDFVYRREVMFLPSSYHLQGDRFVIGVSPYDLKRTKKDWGEYWQNASLEAHYSISGDLKKVFYPL